MPGINKIKLINSLKQKKNRRKYQLFVIEGEKMVDELIKGDLPIHSVYATRQWFSERGFVPSDSRKTSDKRGSYPGKSSSPALKHQTSQQNITDKQDNFEICAGGMQEGTSRVIQKKAEQEGLSLYEIKESELLRISSLKTPNKALAIAYIPDYTIDEEALKNEVTLVLDNVQDPGNLGTLIRSADWFGVKSVILSKNSAEITNPKVVQSTMGSILRVRFYYLDLVTFLKSPKIKEIPVLGTFTEGTGIYSVDLPERGLVVMGNESKGISAGVEKLISQKVSIPSFRKTPGSAESLNLGVAGGIILSEFRRRKWLT